MCCIRCIVLLGVVVPNLNWSEMDLLLSCFSLKVLHFWNHVSFCNASFQQFYIKHFWKRQQNRERQETETERQRNRKVLSRSFFAGTGMYAASWGYTVLRVREWETDRQTDSQTDRAVNKHMAHVSYILHCNELRCEISDCVTFHRSVTLVLCSVLHAEVWCCVFTSSGPDLFRLLGRVCVVSSCCPKFDGVY